jgi:hypothetical protein
MADMLDFRKERRMLMKVRINVKGSAIVYLDRQAWRILFVTDDCHTLSFCDPIYGPEDLAPSKHTRRGISFSATGASISRKLSDSTRRKFLNLSHSDLHGKKSAGRSNLCLHNKMNPDHGYVHMTVPYGKLQVQRYTSKSYYVQQVSPQLGVQKNLKFKPAAEFYIEFEATGLTMNIRESLAGYPRSYNETGTLVLDFDNYCYKDRHGNDFVHHYEWVCDPPATTNTAPKRFNSDRVSGSGQHGILNKDGNCDPVLIEPPPEGNHPEFP